MSYNEFNMTSKVESLSDDIITLLEDNKASGGEGIMVLVVSLAKAFEVVFQEEDKNLETALKRMNELRSDVLNILEMKGWE